MNPLDRKIKFIDLFAGMGGMRLGVEAACKALKIKCECVLTSEIKTHAIETLKLNYEHKNLVGDITKVNASEIPDFDILLAGFPCQPFSQAGKREGFLDTRGTLFFEIERILEVKRPYSFILENVEGLVKHDLDNKNDEIGKTLKVILEKLKSLNYKVTYRVLDSQKFGLAQSRKRIFIVGTQKNEIDLVDFSMKKAVFSEVMEIGLPTIQSEFTEKLLSKFSPSEIIGKSIKDKRGGANNIHSWDIELKGPVSEEQKLLLSKLFKERRKKHWALNKNIEWMDGMPLTYEEIATFYPHQNLLSMLEDLKSKGYLTFEHPKNIVEIIDETGNKRKIRREDPKIPKGYNIVAGKLSFEFAKILDPNDIVPTLVASDVNKLGVFDTNGIRKLSIREGLRLLGFPESFKLDTKESLAFDLIGNSIAVPIVEQISIKIIRSLI